ncbi:thymidylate synthase [Enterococcus sp. DIV0876]|uniref:thymidylate synthase n=1 Tax=Enterococcus sp. DIV0876 TaxID=2774633 RepID=UPI003D2FA506
MNSYQGKTVDDVWIQAEKELKETHNSVKSRTGETAELLHVIMQVDNPKQRWVSSRVPAISIGFALAEVIWILAGSNDSKVINYWNPALKQYAGMGDTYYGAYGERIRKSYGFDQLNSAYEALKNNPESRQIVISIWNPNRDFPDSDGQPRAEDIPCNVCSLLKVRNGKLEWTQIMRSNDLLLGLPYNFVQFTIIQEIMAGWLDLEIGSYCHFSDSLHLYDRDKEKVGAQIPLHVKNTDDLRVTKEKSDKLISQIFDNMKLLTQKNLSKEKLLELSELNQPEEGYCNMMRIISSYVADKLGYSEICEHILSNCSNELYVKLWGNWSQEKKEIREDGK